MPLTAVLDACVLIPASLRDLLLRAAEAELFRPVWSDDVLAEVQRNLVESIGVAEAQAHRLVQTLGRAFPEAPVHNYESLIPSLTNDPKDRHVLAAAIAADAPYIVTSNLRHFPAQALAPHGITSISPDDFLMLLAETDPDTMVEIFVAQFEALRRPPIPLDQALTGFTRFVPRFARFVRAELGHRS
jgi:predicted nucleic acid-binding protein